MESMDPTKRSTQVPADWDMWSFAGGWMMVINSAWTSTGFPQFSDINIDVISSIYGRLLVNIRTLRLTDLDTCPNSMVNFWRFLILNLFFQYVSSRSNHFLKASTPSSKHKHLLGSKLSFLSKKKKVDRLINPIPYGFISPIVRISEH